MALGTAGVTAKLAGLGVVKMAAIALAATSVAAYGGAQADRLVRSTPEGPAAVAVSAATPRPAPSGAVPAPQATAVADGGEAAAVATAAQTAALARQLRLLRKAAALTGDAGLEAEVDELRLLLRGGRGPAGAETLRQWNAAARKASRLLRAIGGEGRSGLQSASLAVLVRSAQAQLAMAAVQGSGRAGVSSAAAAGADAVAHPSSAATSAPPKAAAGSGGGSGGAEDASTVDPASELGGTRVTTPAQAGGSGGSPASELPPVKPVKPSAPVPSSGSGKPQGGTAAQ